MQVIAKPWSVIHNTKALQVTFDHFEAPQKKELKLWRTRTDLDPTTSVPDVPSCPRFATLREKGRVGSLALI